MTNYRFCCSLFPCEIYCKTKFSNITDLYSLIVFFLSYKNSTQLISLRVLFALVLAGNDSFCFQSIRFEITLN